MQCQTVGQCCTLEKGLLFQQVKIQERQGRVSAWAAYSRTTTHCYRDDNITLIARPAPMPQGSCSKAQSFGQLSGAPWVSLYEAKAHTHPRKEVGGDTDIRRSAYRSEERRGGNG